MRKTLLALSLTTAVAHADSAPVAPSDTPSVVGAGSELGACQQIIDDASRLACFDALVEADNVIKRPVNLSQTLKSTITGKPQIVLEEAQIVPETLTDTGVVTELGLSARELSEHSLLSLSYDLERNSERGLWSARPHNANYILPLYVNARPNRYSQTPTQAPVAFSDNEMRNAELKFQLSLKTKAGENLFGTDADLWLGYTQLSHWQVYNEDNSRPFRAHDYEPEIFLTQPVAADLPLGGRLRLLGAGAVHHSNGEADPLSRSWNRLYLMGGAEWGRLTIMPRLWTRVVKKDGTKPDDNPDISDYYGYGDVKFIYQLESGSNISGLARLNPKTGKGALQLDYVRPLRRGASGYVQLFHGYGQSIVDYNHEATSVGVGIMLTDWMGL